MHAGGTDPGEKIEAEPSEPDKESGGRPSRTEKSSLRAELIKAAVTLLAAAVTAVVTVEITHALNSAAPSHPEDSGDMPVPNCPTCYLGGKTFTEVASGDGSHPTFRNPLLFGGPGPAVQPGKTVEVACRFFQPNAPPSVKHDGWWYLIASQPWNRHYYTVANSYLNGDPPEGPYITNVDNGVPECTTKS
jgi:hypothetical protein